MKLAIDQLQDSDDLATAIFHRQREQGARSIASLFVVAPIKSVRTAAWDVMGIGKIDDLSTHSRITRQGIFAHRKHEFREGKLQTVILRELKAKMPIPTARFECVGARLLNQVKGTGIRPSNVAGLGQE